MDLIKVNPTNLIKVKRNRVQINDDLINKQINKQDYLLLLFVYLIEKLNMVIYNKATATVSVLKLCSNIIEEINENIKFSINCLESSVIDR